jgi:Mg-dependent DNase
MNNDSPFIDAHTHKIPTSNNIAIVNILLRRDDNHNEEPLISSNVNQVTYFSVGIHPWYLENWEKSIDRLEEIANVPKVLAIGECGLDRTRETPFDRQKQAFLTQISVSENLKKPVIVHCVKAYSELIQLRKQAKPTKPWIIHGFNNNLEVAQKCIENGMMLSFGRSLLYNSKLTEVIKLMNLNNFLLETDENEVPIEEIYTKCADIKAISVKQLKLELSQNFNKLFNNVTS